MKGNEQLFRVLPPVELVMEVLGLFGIINFNESYNFTYNDIINKNVATKLSMMPLDDYYINGKYNKYCTDLNNKKCVTILRQLLKIYGYKVVTVEKYNLKHKYLSYHIKKNRDPILPSSNNTILEFD